MRAGFLMLIAFLLLVTSLAHVQSADERAGDRAYIRQAEPDWAESVVANDVSVLELMNFVGVDIDGSHYSKADVIKDFRTQPQARLNPAGADSPWTPLINQPTFLDTVNCLGAANPLLLTDGTVMVQNGGCQDWWRLTPDKTGSYVNGTWTELAR